MSSNDIHFEERGCAGIVTLDRQHALNAVTDEMLSALSERIERWEADAAVTRIIIKAAPGRAFSAGGDIRHLYECGIRGDFDFGFFAREYALNARIAALTTPYVALIDGIAMGGGVGVSFHGSHVIAGDHAKFAMPECGIGFFPDVGGSYLLSRLPGAFGIYLGLTGERIDQRQMVACGLADAALASGDLAALEDALCEGEAVDEAVARLAKPLSDLPLHPHIEAIDAAFDAKDVFAIVKRLKGLKSGEHADWATATLDTLAAKSPTSLAIAHRQITLGRDRSMAECMRMEFRILNRILPRHDFYEGIRAAIIDKDNAPQWEPATLDAVDARLVDEHFEPLPDGELELA